jgi:hypothetical protein
MVAPPAATLAANVLVKIVKIQRQRTTSSAPSPLVAPAFQTKLRNFVTDERPCNTTTTEKKDWIVRKAMTKNSDSSSAEAARELRVLREQRHFPAVSSAKEPDNSLVNLLRQGMIFAQQQGQDRHDPRAPAIDRYEFLPFRTSSVPVSNPLSLQAQQQPLGELLEEVMQVISATDCLGEAPSSPASSQVSSIRHHRNRGSSDDGSASPDRGPQLPKQWRRTAIARGIAKKDMGRVGCDAARVGATPCCVHSFSISSKPFIPGGQGMVYLDGYVNSE